jgi:hypothetical protein
MEERAHQESLIMSREEKNLINPSFNSSKIQGSFNRSKTEKEKDSSKKNEIKSLKTTVAKIDEDKKLESKCRKK